MFALIRHSVRLYQQFIGCIRFDLNQLNMVQSLNEPIAYTSSTYVVPVIPEVYLS